MNPLSLKFSQVSSLDPSSLVSRSLSPLQTLVVLGTMLSTLRLVLRNMQELSVPKDPVHIKRPLVTL
ncbi:hypothetical protein ERO13_D08G258266v2 [Gossypium hirsutum]|uniref:Uncharacterized protein n=1 Tax=Gossypium tomentosum TaxID=34277 RepID=A0A5D2K030_GOSTO|nr:hypothetical protein ERO13_D08G258266v2 [Gossypium hirsutum]TYH60481.1 hypothetical protein ES332_D08G296000v1 [Gossypium tomentosum]